MNDYHLLRHEFVRGVFGRGHRLDIWDAVLKHEIEPADPFTVKSIFDELSETTMSPRPTISMVWGEFVRLEELNMTRRVSPQQSKLVPHVRLDSPMWPVVQHAIEVIEVIYPPAH
ncbi:MAG TPA: hypothetical protein VIJ68_03195 [Candidatus Saccharimonadales bacterium]